MIQVNQSFLLFWNYTRRFPFVDVFFVAQTTRIDFFVFGEVGVKNSWGWVSLWATLDHFKERSCMKTERNYVFHWNSLEYCISLIFCSMSTSMHNDSESTHYDALSGTSPIVQSTGAWIKLCLYYFLQTFSCGKIRLISFRMKDETLSTKDTKIHFSSTNIRCLPILITKIWLQDAIYVYTSCAICRFG